MQPSASSSHAPASVTYSASATPVALSVDGTKSDNNGNLLTLIGRHQTGSVSAGGCPIDPASYNWSVSGPQLFDHIGSQLHTYEPFVGAHTASTVSFYASKDASETVSCTCDVLRPGNGVKIGSVTATQMVGVRKPSYNLVLGAISGTYTGYDPDNVSPTSVNSGETSQGLAAGGASVGFAYYAVNGSDFPGDGGTVSLCQLVDESSSYSPSGSHSTHGPVLDNAFPYNGHTFPVDAYGTGPTPDLDGDRPSRSLSGFTGFSINVNYTTTEMYHPSGGVDVPLKTKNWTWITSGSKGGSPAFWSAPTGGIATSQGGGTDFDLISATWYAVETN